MAEYYGYAERSADDYIDWGKIGKNMSEMLIKEKDIREQKKKEIDDATDQLSNYINNEQPFGEHKGASDAALDLASQSSNFLLMQTKLLKSGQLSPEDFVRNREKLKNSIKTSYTALKNYQSSYAQIMNDYKDGKISYGQLLNAAEVEKFGNFTNNGFFVTPATGEIVVAGKEERIIDGKKVYVMSSDPTKVTTPNAINALILSKWNKFDQEGNAKEWVDSLPEKIISIQQVGSRNRAGTISEILDVTDPRASNYSDADKKIIADFRTAEDNKINAMLANNYDRASLMLDYMKSTNGNQFKTVYGDPEAAKKDPSKINMVKDKSTGNYVPEFTEEQIKLSNEFMRQDLRAKYDRKYTIRPYTETIQEKRPPTQGELDQQTQRQNVRDIGKYLAEVAYGTPETARAAFGALEQIAGGNTNIVRTAKGLMFTDPEGNKKEILFEKNGKKLNREQIAEAGGSWFAGTKARSEDLRAGARSARTTNRINEEFFQTTQGARGDNPYAIKYISDNLWTGGDNVKNIANDINTKFSKLGISAKEKDGKLILINSVGGTQEFDPKDDSFRGDILYWSQTNYNKKLANTIYPQKGTGPGGGALSEFNIINPQ